jgi:hypothetical protein
MASADRRRSLLRWNPVSRLAAPALSQRDLAQFCLGCGKLPLFGGAHLLGTVLRQCPIGHPAGCHRSGTSPKSRAPERNQRPLLQRFRPRAPMASSRRSVVARSPAIPRVARSTWLPLPSAGLQHLRTCEIGISVFSGARQGALLLCARVARLVGIDVERPRDALDHFFRDHDLLDAFEARQVEHGVE